MMRKFGLITMCFVVLVSVCHADIVSWNYNDYSDAYATQSTDVAGVGTYSASYWNDSWLDGLTTDLLDNNGVATTVDISWSSYNTWHIQASHPGTDDDGSYNKEILNGYLNAGPAGWNPPQTYSDVTLSEIPYSSYNIIVYFSSDVVGREGYVTDGTTTFYFNTLGPASIPSPGNAVFVQATDTTEAGYLVGANYAVFSNLSGTSQTVTVQMRDNDEWAGIAAVQIAEVTTITYNSPAYGATLIPVARTASENDLVFTVIDPNIADVEVYLSANDPNVPDLIKTINSVGTGQQTVTLETELGTDLSFETAYYWQVIGYEPNTLIPANGNDVAVPGPVWNFTTAPEAPLITVDPIPYIAVDAGEPNIVLTANGINGDFQWYKDGSPIADAGGVYAGTLTNTLTIYDVQLADEGYYTLQVGSLVGSDESAPTRVMIHRQTSYYDFESTSVVDGNDVFVDSIDGYPAVLMQESASAGLPTASDANQLDLTPGFPGTKGLLLDNGDDATDPNGQYLRIYPGVCDYEDITISLWAHAKSIDGWARLFDFGTAQNNAIWFTPDNGAGISRFDIVTPAGGDQYIDSDWIAPEAWHHVAITLSGNTGKLFIDGLWVTTNTGVTNNPIDLGATLNYIGKSQWPDPEFNGLIDELKIYNYALSAEQIAQEYLTYADPTGSICDTELNNAVGVWRYDQGWQAGDVWVGGNNNCKIDLPDFAGMAARWLEDINFYLP